MLWIRLWVHPYRDTISLVTETENLGYSLATSHNVGQCFRLICNGSHINTNHLICVLQPSFAVNVPMDVSMEVSLLPCYHLLTCYMAPILVSRHILVPGPGLHSIGVMIFFVRPWNHSYWLHVQLKFYGRCLTTLLCWGYEYECVLTMILPLLSLNKKLFWDLWVPTPSYCLHSVMQWLRL